MSKHINVNPGQYKEAGRERQGEGIIHGNERNEYEHTQARVPHIPNQERASQPSADREEPQTDEEAQDDAAGPNLSDDEGVTD